jgi:hypothetical protein
MPLVPLFDTPTALPRPELAPAPAAVVLAAVAAATALALVGLATAVVTGRSVALSRVRESL